MLEFHQTIHASSGYCLWTLLSFVVLGIMVVVAGVHMVNQKKRRNDFNKEMKDKYNLSEVVEGN